MSRFIISIACLLVLSFSVVSAAADSGTESRPFAPAQSEFSRTAGEQSPYATDHVMVRLTREGYERSRLTALDKLGDAVAATGLATLDATARDIGVTKITKAHGPFAHQLHSEK